MGSGLLRVLLALDVLVHLVRYHPWSVDRRGTIHGGRGAIHGGRSATASANQGADDDYGKKFETHLGFSSGFAKVRGQQTVRGREWMRAITKMRGRRLLS